MLRSKKLTRRSFLRMSAATAAVTTLAACGGGGGGAAPTAAPAAPTAAPAAPTAAPAATAVPVAPTSPPAATAIPAVTTKFKQAPSLDKVSGLPSVDERLPKNPYTPPHAWLGVGKYGGVLNKTYNNNWGITGFIHEMQ